MVKSARISQSDRGARVAWHRWSPRGLRCALAAFGLASTLLAGPALAEPSDADRATALTLAQEGREALAKNDFATARDRFARADALVHAPTLLLGLARSQVGL